MTGDRYGFVDHPPDGGYTHDALLYDSRAQLVDVAAPFLMAGLAAGEAAVIATSG